MEHLHRFSNFSAILEDNSSVKIKFPCIPDKVLPFIDYISKNSEDVRKKLGVDLPTLILLTKASMGIIGRESKFGNYSERTDLYSEIARSKLKLGSLIDWGIDKYGSYKYGPDSGKKITQSLGMGQITSQFWEKYKLDQKIGPYNDSFDAKSQGMAVLYALTDRYKSALQKGLKKEPSVNPVLQKYGLVTSISGTGNNALDLAILGHNMGEKVITQWCKTSHPLYAAPKSGGPKYSPFKTKESFDSKSKLLGKVQDESLKKFPGELDVKPEVIPNFFPNLKGPLHTSIGYVEEVSKYVKQFGCLDKIGTI